MTDCYIYDQLMELLERGKEGEEPYIIELRRGVMEVSRRKRPLEYLSSLRVSINAIFVRHDDDE